MPARPASRSRPRRRRRGRGAWPWRGAATGGGPGRPRRVGAAGAGARPARPGSQADRAGPDGPGDARLGAGGAPGSRRGNRATRRPGAADRAQRRVLVRLRASSTRSATAAELGPAAEPADPVRPQVALAAAARRAHVLTVLGSWPSRRVLLVGYTAYRIGDQGQPRRAQPVDAIVVLGAAQFNGAPAPSSRRGSSTPSPCTSEGVAPVPRRDRRQAAGDRTTEAARRAPGRSPTACRRRRSSPRTRAGRRSSR